MTNKEFDILWRLAYGTQPVSVDEAATFKESLGMDDGMYLTGRAKSKDKTYSRVGDKSQYWRIKD
jgi:hypothetical protein